MDVRPEEVRDYKEAAQKSGVKIHSIMNSDHWRYSLTDNDPEVVKKCVEGIQTSMRNARELGAGTVLLVPGIVTPNVPYGQVYKRSQEQIRKLIPLAKEFQVIIAVENVGNRFLLSPLEFSRYVDEFDSPWVKAYFDIGNVVASGYPQDWIRTLGKRIVKLDVKDFNHKTDKWADIGEGTVDWDVLRGVLAEINFSGWATAEVGGGDRNRLKKIKEQMDRVLG